MMLLSRSVVTVVILASACDVSFPYSKKRVLEEPKCGERFLNNDLEDKRIVGGHVSTPGAWPWQVALLLNDKQTCGGSLISPQWVVSASHCFVGSLLSKDPKDWTVTLGEHHLKNEDWFEQIRKVKAIYLHPEYKESENKVADNKLHSIPPDNDVALLQLETPAIFDNFVSPICLLPQGAQFPAGKECYVTGWGHTQWRGTKPDILREAKVKLVHEDTCNAEKSYGGAIHNRALCAGFEEGGVDACQYDSGGPLACQHEGLWYLTGVVSWGHNCGHPHKYGVYADMQVMTDWVRKIVNEN